MTAERWLMLGLALLIAAILLATFGVIAKVIMWVIFLAALVFIFVAMVMSV